MNSLMMVLTVFVTALAWNCQYQDWENAVSIVHLQVIVRAIR